MIVADFADFCLVVSMIVDDLYRALPACVKPRSASDVRSDSELLTMARVGECLVWDEETAAISQWQLHPDRFPHVPPPSLQPATARPHRCPAADPPAGPRPARLCLDRQCVIDPLPVPVLGFHRVPGATSAGAWRADGADYGKVVTKKQTGALVVGQFGDFAPATTGVKVQTDPLPALSGQHSAIRCICWSRWAASSATSSSPRPAPTIPRSPPNGSRPKGICSCWATKDTSARHGCGRCAMSNG